MSALPALGLGAIHGGEGDPARALALAAEHAPYLARTLERLPGFPEHLEALGPDGLLSGQLDAMRAAGDVQPLDAAMQAMRKAKEAAHIAIAAADLSGLWSLDQVVEGLTALADASVETALRQAIRATWASGKLGERKESEELPGLFVLAMGKMGARELNYSSDIDLIVLFDLEVVPVDPNRVKEGMTRLAQTLVKVLDERTVDGYVFRTDLRLRPDPASTAPAVSTQFAEGYYESVGQNWERMAHIKARVCAGDAKVGAAYLKELEPYVWRRHLDYWAIADIHSIKRQIHSHGGHQAIDAADFDVKLGRGGIREIEFFAQVQQLILGGRQPALRAPGTKQALREMVAAGVVGAEAEQDLVRSYDFLRSLEHRLQMVNDEQTHRLPDIAEKRAGIATLGGYDDAARFETDVAAVRSRVHGVYSDLFATEERLSGEGGNLVFTGVDDDPGTVATLTDLGFSNPAKIIRVFQAWHRGGVSATRSARGRQLLTSLGPKLLQAMSQVGEPDVAFDRFADFFSSLTAGVQTQSLLLAEPALTRDLLETMVFAPRLAADLARRPALLDAMLDPHFRAPVSSDPPGAREKKLRKEIEVAGDFEGALNAARRFHREEAFRIGWQLLRGAIKADDAGAAYADLADACVAALAEAAEHEVTSRFDGTIGKWVVCALGKFGGRELTASSDLDLMLVYDPEGDNGGQLAPRFVQRLVAALTAPTEEGGLYEVDMQLRPSGRAGPVAVRFSSFQGYYETEAWTWEFMALTRLRPVAGDEGLAQRIVAAAHAALRGKSADPNLTADVADMRRRMARERPAKSRWDLKLAPGGLVDIEFVIQHAILQAAADHPDSIDPTSRNALAALQRAGRFDTAETQALGEALAFQLDLQQALRIASGEGFDPEKASPSLKAWLANHMGASGFSALETRLTAIQSTVERIRTAKLGPLATDSG